MESDTSEIRLRSGLAGGGLKSRASVETRCFLHTTDTPHRHTGQAGTQPHIRHSSVWCRSAWKGLAGCRACTDPVDHSHAEPAPSPRQSPRRLRAMRDRSPQRSAPRSIQQSPAHPPPPAARELLSAIMAQIGLIVFDCEEVGGIDPLLAHALHELAVVRETDLHAGNSKASRPGAP